jgi:hypothetical protein
MLLRKIYFEKLVSELDQYLKKRLALFLKHYPESPGGFIITQKTQASLIVHGKEVSILGFESIDKISFLMVDF